MSGSLPLTYLFVPGNRPGRFAKALASGADRIIIDLEDAVAPADKANARAAIADWMRNAGEQSRKVLIRINDAATVWHAEDLQLAAQAQALCVMLPKCEAASQVAALLAVLPQTATVLPLIETARGMLALTEIAVAPRVSRLAFGSLDYMADLDIPADSLALDFAATQIALASRAAGLASPVAGVTPDLDAVRVEADMQHARSLGFGAKMCIHPSQIAAVRHALAPSAEELAWARRVLQAWNASAGGAIQVDGKMVDPPVVLKAGRMAALAGAADPVDH
ncbi:HpcH/HpaI aldolase/citrate lyase family protein [Polaromonas jejuensis]|uniref:HpcH/HpaI aldolase/citrate lyase family protein n=1 Tax=Polaromonas jejuensis TaxID=457502 RepID=A0ABW0QHQ9_9BURK|nr:CoA ester lyase [Polaromonas jejuensis]